MKVYEALSYYFRNVEDILNFLTRQDVAALIETEDFQKNLLVAEDGYTYWAPDLRDGQGDQPRF